MKASAISLLAPLSLALSAGCSSAPDATDATQSAAVTSSSPGTPAAPARNKAPDTPCATHHVQDAHGGPLVSNPIVFNLFMGQYWESTAGQAFIAADNGAMRSLLVQSGIYQPISEYVSTGPGTFGGTDWVGVGADQSAGALNPVPEEMIQSFIDFELQQNRVPAPVPGRTIYVVNIGKGAWAQRDLPSSSHKAFNGHHWFYSSAQAGGQTLHYAVVDYEPSLSGLTEVAYHELMETMTDPELSGFRDTTLAEGEVGDLCETGGVVKYGGYSLQKIWSQQACACVAPAGSGYAGPLLSAQNGFALDTMGATLNGERPVMEPYTFGANGDQGWFFGNDGTIRDANGKCLDVAEQSKDDGAMVWLWDCWGGTNQQWRFLMDGSIRNVGSGKCLDVYNQDKDAGALLVQWSCWGGPNQQWATAPN